MVALSSIAGLGGFARHSSAGVCTLALLALFLVGCSKTEEAPSAAVEASAPVAAPAPGAVNQAPTDEAEVVSRFEQERFKIARSISKDLGISELDAESSTSSWYEVHESGPKWFVWAQTPVDLKTKPSLLRKIANSKEFSVGIDLSMLNESIDLPSSEISKNLRETLVKSNEDILLIEVFAIPDPRFFLRAENSKRLLTFEVDLKKMRELGAYDALQKKQGSSYTDADLFELLDKFSLGRNYFTFRSTQKQGEGSIAFSFWVDRRPIDEISLSLCVGGSSAIKCGPSPHISRPPVGMLGKQNSNAPDASLHLLDLGEDALAAVFYCQTCGDNSRPGYVGWHIPITADSLENIVTTQIVPSFNSVIAQPIERPKDNSAFLQGGRALYNALFDYPDVDARNAEDVFRSFVKKASIAEGAPILYIRTIKRDQRFSLLPLNMMVVPLSDGEEAFLGFDVNIEGYLSDRPYLSSSQCISRWFFLIPDAREGLFKNAYNAFKDWIPRYKSASEKSIFSENEIPEFSQWIGASDVESSGLALVTLSHHAPGRLCYADELCEEGGDSIMANALRRRFTFPSIAILNGCGTVGIGQSEFVQKLAERDMSAIIATSVKVDAEMAGTFLNLFSDVLQKNGSDASYSISRARFDAVKRLKDVSPPGGHPYGPAALAYMTLGDGGVRACVPPGPGNIDSVIAKGENQ
ncbi:hypothetical protein VVD49_18510 [Uliginosibacterium sp. H3]|uniref:CHAT domain-containing protein n=1 Tax=Uliginosibacterium silvisoli TaxID=3114758 RepID=A0ABU6K7X6_9RHOO|nr:hypothetical protein [Uliginosibacterium sp. H3]